MKLNAITVHTNITGLDGLIMVLVGLFGDVGDIAFFGVLCAGAYLISKAFCIYRPQIKKN